MHPIIYQIGPVTIYSFGVMLALAVIICTYGLSRDAQKLSISQEQVFDFVFWVVINGIIGARIFFIFLNLNYFIEQPAEIVMVQKGGLAWQGSLLLGLGTAVWYIRKHKWPLGRFLDIAAPYAALGQAIGRIGCFLNGCCYGKVCSLGLYFPTHHARLYPTQLYDSFGLFLLFFVLKKFQNNFKIEGQAFLLYLFWAALQRFIVEFFRADHDILWAQLSIFQLVCLVIMISVLYANAHLQSRSTKR